MLFNRRQRRFLTLSILFMGGSAGFSKLHEVKMTSRKTEPALYQELGLAGMGLAESVFQRALAGWKALSDRSRLSKPEILSIADLSQSCNAKRLYVIDLARKSVLFNTYVAHGRNSGDEFATRFGNTKESFRSSLGFYVTGDPYKGEHGLSLRLAGQEEGVNNNAEPRGIVVHGAPYVSESFIRQYGRLGRSLGCPAIPQNLTPDIIGRIKEGSCFFVYYPDSNYLRSSTLLNKAR